MLKSVVYTSVSNVPMHESVLKDILASSKRNNEELKLTGLLIYFEGTFLQVLEGPIENVDMMIKRIQEDDRNKDMVILLDEPIEEREFGQWDMGFRRIGLDRDELTKLEIGTIQQLKDNSDVKAILKTFYELNINSKVKYLF